ncbi:hypothetical protein J2S78_000154 [Salibacterium salarium]|nr:hypothetical protein [Salibacterium salarium]
MSEIVMTFIRYTDIGSFIGSKNGITGWDTDICSANAS